MISIHCACEACAKVVERLEKAETALAAVAHVDGHCPAPALTLEVERLKHQAEVVHRNQREMVERLEREAIGANIRAEAAQTICDDFREALAWTRQTVHQAHHDGPVETCPKSICEHVRKVLG